jgi:hypothetical protein
MENPTPFDLNEAIRRWQQELSTSPAFCADNVEELASHLRASIQKLKANGLSEEEAFQIAASRIGERGQLEREFAKVHPAVNWSLPVILFWIVAGLYLFPIVLSMSAIVLYSGLFLSRIYSGFLPFFTPFLNVVQSLVICGISIPFFTAFSLVVVFVSCLCWRLITGSWRGFHAFIISRFEGLAHTKPMLTAMKLAVVAMVALSSEYIVMFLAGRMMAPSSSHIIPWGFLACNVAINVVLITTMILLARRGLYKTPPVDGGQHNCTTSNSR